MIFQKTFFLNNGLRHYNALTTSLQNAKNREIEKQLGDSIPLFSKIGRIVLENTRHGLCVKTLVSEISMMVLWSAGFNSVLIQTIQLQT